MCGKQKAFISVFAAMVVIGVFIFPAASFAATPSATATPAASAASTSAPGTSTVQPKAPLIEYRPFPTRHVYQGQSFGIWKRWVGRYKFIPRVVYIWGAKDKVLGWRIGSSAIKTMVLSSRGGRYPVYYHGTKVTVWVGKGPKPAPAPVYSWRSAVYSCYGGPSEAQGIAWDSCPWGGTTTALEAPRPGYPYGIPYFAHKTMPLGTWMAFTDGSGKVVKAVCVDRGPYSGDREFDLGPGIWHQLSLDGVGTISVSPVR